ncbi:MAG: HlyD family efflux transporter periplasmic adaptor subunit [Cellvibrio sp.]|uniref:efflux RND transporter periplasmic adaptor subunit n=1 Tax=Cellvibrio sp. TaxID=1965322 RepID=UPI0031A7070C
MDIVKPKVSPRFNHLILLGGAMVVVIVLMAVAMMQPSGSQKLERSSLLSAVVQRGNLQVSVEGYGILRSDKQTLITALTPATVAEVLLRSGAEVKADSIILRLDNPELLQEVKVANVALTQEQANLRRLKLSNQRELLAEQAVLAELTATLKSVQLRSEAEKGLAGGAVSMLAYKTTLLEQEQMQERVNLHTQRIAQLKEVMREALIIQQEQINQANTHYQNMQQRADRLLVRAGIEGVLQRMPVELGQSVIAGQELALVGSDKDLKALIRVPQSRAEQLKVGQAATINTRREQVAGLLTRITPEVREGTIEVEIAFTEGVPTSARPELNVDAKIFTAQIEDALFIERPVNVQNYSHQAIFRLAENNKSAQLQELSFGAEAGKYIQITKGANENERFILSDTTRLHDVKTIQIVD